jgi:fructokinase
VAETDSPDGDPPGTGSEAIPVQRRPIVVGEVLFDQFPDGTTVLGGAPFNVAWHLRAFGLRPLVVTRVGDDALGEQVLRTMDRWRMNTTGVQLDQEAPTGRVLITIDEHGPRFDIPEDQAFDHLEIETALHALDGLDVGLLYHGSLITRSRAAGRTMRAIRQSVQVPIFVDVNLRDPWWSKEMVTSLIRGARWVKLNDDELGRLSGREPAAGLSGSVLAAAELARRHGVEELVVTCGERGAFVWVGDRSVAGRPPAAVDVVDTVGAGDAFSAVWIAGFLYGWGAETTLVRALDFAAVICGVRGATTDDRQIYDRCLEAWSLT